jgi:hypothetical protein
MARIFLDKNNEFTVKEWKTANIIIGVVFAALFIFALYNLGLNNWKSIGLFLCLGLLIGGMWFRYRKQSTAQSVILRVNSAGIYYYGKLITGWSDFYNAYVTNDVAIGSYSDNFELVIEFYREDQLIRRKIPLTNTQDKSEEEVYAAVMYFYKQHNGMGIETIDAGAEIVK